MQMNLSTEFCPVGYMPMPVHFRHRDTFLRGRPRHLPYDEFWRKHPPMDTARRAKIFHPFDALSGFSECIARCAAESQEDR